MRSPKLSTRPLAKTMSAQAQPVPATLHIRSRARRGNLLLDLPIGGRLTLGFLTAALIAALLVGTIGILRAQSLSRQTSFYQNLLHTNTSLTTGASFLQLMNTQTHLALDHAALPQPSQETLTTDQNAVKGLTTRYDTILTGYIAGDLLTKHVDEVALLAEADHTGQVTQQTTLAGSALRTWQVYRGAQAQILQDIAGGNLAVAQHLEQTQGEPTNADALSALRALILFDQRLAASVQDAASVEEQSQLYTTIIGSVLAFIAIVLVGWLISGTLVKRLKQLRNVTRAVERGQLDARVTVVGRDEIADVSASVNAMLEAILGLFQQTRRQRDALTNAAEHLFSDMRVVSAGDLSINAVVSNDPIGMLANAFNFTVGRFRRFVLRTQIISEQLDVISRQELERSEVFVRALKNQRPASREAISSIRDGRASSGQLETTEKEQADLVAQIQRAREHLQHLTDEGITQQVRSVFAVAEQISHTLRRMSRALAVEAEAYSRSRTTTLETTRLHVQEVRALETLLPRLAVELQRLQQHSLQECRELDAELSSIATTTSALKLREAQPLEPLPNPSSQDIARLGSEFSSEIATMAGQLAVLVREMRTGIVAFQVETANNTLAEKPPSSNMLSMEGESALRPPAITTRPANR